MESDGLERDKFRLLLEQLQDNAKTFRANLWGTMGFLVLVIGSLITSQTLQSALSTSPNTAQLTFGVTFFIVVMHTLVLAGVYFRSKRIMFAMKALGYVEPKFYKYYSITLAHLSASASIDLALFVLIAIIIANLGHVSFLYLW